MSSASGNHVRDSLLARRIFLLASATLAITAVTARGITALGSPELLDWDETYYASTTSTAAHGLGLYPYVLGYPSIAHMGGVGYVVMLYVLAYKLLGPHLMALRLVSFAVSLFAVAGVAELTRRLYGSAAGLAALALTPSLLVFQLSNTIRFDVFAIAFVAWALVLHAHVAERKGAGGHALAGLVFALGLQVHLHTAAAAFAVGFAYLIASFTALRQRTPARRAMKPLAAFVAGYVLGAMLFAAVNILPDPRGFFRTAALARLSAVESPTDLNLTARMDAGRLAETFLSPAVIVRKEFVRYRSMLRDMRWWEAALWVSALPTFLLLRAPPGGYAARTLFAGAIVGGGIVFNSASPLYASAILPFFVPALATFVTHGFSRRARVEYPDVSRGSLALVLVLAAAIVPSALSKTVQGLERLRHADHLRPAPAVVALVTDTVSTDCILAGPTDLYAAHFMAYPRFVGTRRVEVLIGSTYYDLQEQPVAYWYEKRPDVVFGAPAEALRTYLSQAKYETLAPGVWRKPDNLSDGCLIGDPRPSATQTGTWRRPAATSMDPGSS